MTTPTPPTFWDATGPPFEIADTDRYAHWKRLGWLYVTDGRASHLAATEHDKSPSPNEWEGVAIRTVLHRPPENSRVSVNAEFWRGKYDWQLHTFGCMMARLKDARPDIDWALYDAHPRQHADVFAHVERDIGWISVNIFPGKHMTDNLTRLSRLMNGMRKGDIERRDVVVCVGHRWQGGEAPDEMIEADIRSYILPAVKSLGITHIGVWEGPNGRRDKIPLVAEMVEDVFGGADAGGEVV
jgi:hypothetical protein